MVRMLLCVFCVGLLATSIAHLASGERSEDRILSRKKRYLIFPEGASLLARYSIATNLVGVKDPGNWFHVIELDAIYHLPNSSEGFHTKKPPKKYHSEKYHLETYHPDYHYFPNVYNKPEKFYLQEKISKGRRRPEEQYYYKHRRNRREVYEQLKSIFEMQGLDGNSCLMRAICEVKHILAKAENLSIFEEIFLKIFTIPPGDDDVFGNDFENSIEQSDERKCLEWIKECSVSLLDFVFSNVYSES